MLRGKIGVLDVREGSHISSHNLFVLLRLFLINGIYYIWTYWTSKRNELEEVGTLLFLDSVGLSKLVFFHGDTIFILSLFDLFQFQYCLPLDPTVFGGKVKGTCPAIA